MEKRPRRNHSSAFKTKVALAALKDDKNIGDLATQFDVQPYQIKQRKDLPAGVEKQYFWKKVR